MATITLEIHGLRFFWPNVPCGDTEEWKLGSDRFKRELIRILQDDRMELIGMSRGQHCDLDEYYEIQFAPKSEEEPEENDDD